MTASGEEETRTLPVRLAFGGKSTASSAAMQVAPLSRPIAERGRSVERRRCRRCSGGDGGRVGSVSRPVEPRPCSRRRCSRSRVSLCGRMCLCPGPSGRPIEACSGAVLLCVVSGARRWCCFGAASVNEGGNVDACIAAMGTPVGEDRIVPCAR